MKLLLFQSLSSNIRHFFRVNFLINAAFEHLKIPRLLGGRRLFHFFSPKCGVLYCRVAFIRGRRLKEEIRY